MTVTDEQRAHYDRVKQERERLHRVLYISLGWIVVLAMLLAASLLAAAPDSNIHAQRLLSVVGPVLTVRVLIFGLTWLVDRFSTTHFDVIRLRYLGTYGIEVAAGLICVAIIIEALTGLGIRDLFI